MRIISHTLIPVSNIHENDISWSKGISTMWTAFPYSEMFELSLASRNIIYKFISSSRASIISSFSRFLFSKILIFKKNSHSFPPTYRITQQLSCSLPFIAFFNLKISLSLTKFTCQNFTSLFVYIRAGINSHIEFLRSCRGERKVLVKLGFFKANSISDERGYKSRKPVTRLGRIPTRIIHIRYHSEAREEHLAKTSLAYWWLLPLLFPYTFCYPLSMQSQLYIKPCLLREIDLDCCKKKKSVHDELFNEFIRISKRCFINFSFSKKEIGFHWMRRNILLLIVS